MQLRDLECPYCGGPVRAGQDGSTVPCRWCGSMLDFQRSLCPGCGILNRETRRFCAQCGSAIVRACPACRQDNWAGLQQCSACGHSLDLVEIMIQSRLVDTATRLRVQQQEAFHIKRREAAQAEARVEQFREMERQRLEELARRQAQDRRRDQLFIRGALIVLALCLLLMAALTLYPR